MLTLIANADPLEEVGLKTLKGYLENSGIPVRAIYLNAEPRQTMSEALILDILSLVKSSKLVGLSMMSKDLRLLGPLSLRIRQELGLPVVWGGIHPTALSEESLDYCDYVCIGEGEEPLLQLYRHIAEGAGRLGDIPNLAYRENGAIRRNEASFGVESLDDLPFPDYRFANSYYLCGSLQKGMRLARIPEDVERRSAFFEALDQQALLFYSQRGCKMACTYCSNSLYLRMSKKTGVKWYRRSSVERIKKELRHYLELLPFVKLLCLNDDDILDRSVDELDEIAKFIQQELKRPFNVNAIPALVTVEKISVLAGRGLEWVFLGVQSGSERILKEVYRRQVLPSEVLQAARILHEFRDQGVKSGYGFILDNPYETDDDWRASLRLALDLPRPRKLILYTLTFFPGTELMRRVTQEGLQNPLSIDFGKHYHYDFERSYGNFVFLLNLYPMPVLLNRILMSDFMVRSLLVAPVRWLLASLVGVTRLMKRLRQGKDRLALRFAYRGVVADSAGGR